MSSERVINEYLAVLSNRGLLFQHWCEVTKKTENFVQIMAGLWIQN